MSEMRTNVNIKEILRLTRTTWKYANNKVPASIVTQRVWRLQIVVFPSVRRRTCGKMLAKCWRGDTFFSFSRRKAIIFLKIVNGLVDFDSSVSPKIRHRRPTRSTISSASVQFRNRKCRTTTFQKSFLVRSTRIWKVLTNSLDSSSYSYIDSFRNALLKCFFTALSVNCDPETSRTWKSICPNCNTARSLATNIICY